MRFSTVSTGRTLSAPEAIEQLLSAQIQLRNNRRLQAAMRSSRLPAVKQLRDFDFAFQPSLRREQIESLYELGSPGNGGQPARSSDASVGTGQDLRRLHGSPQRKH